MGGTVHALWSCLKVQTFQTTVQVYISVMRGVDFKVRPGVFIRGKLRFTEHTIKSRVNWIQTSVIIRKQVIMRERKAADASLFSVSQK